MTGKIADRYISPGGRDAHFNPAADVLALASFVLWHDPGHLMGGVRADDAALALARLLDVPLVDLRKIVKS